MNIRNMGNSGHSSDIMSGRERIILGAIGGAVVCFATYPIGDKGYASFITEPDIVVFIGFVLRLIGCLFLGGLWAYLHGSETDRMRVFQLGLVAPAMLAGMVYANKSATIDKLIEGSQLLDLPSIAFISEAQAAPKKGKGKRSLIVRIIRGAVGG
jgi:hypothetical protein